jgi:cell division protein FtsB
MAMRLGIGFLAILVVLLQGRLWLSKDGFREVQRLQHLIEQQQEENTRMTGRNQRLEAEVVELRTGEASLEERARSDLGLVRPNETFYIFGEPRPSQ